MAPSAEWTHINDHYLYSANYTSNALGLALLSIH